MNSIRKKAIAEDLRKVGTTAVAASLISLFIGNTALLSACAAVSGLILWGLGILMTLEE